MKLNRRDFLRQSRNGMLTAATAHLLPGLRLMPELSAEESKTNTNWLSAKFGASATASSYCSDPPWGYKAENVFSETLANGWQTLDEGKNAWVEVTFPSPRKVSELWLLGEPIPDHVIGAHIYTMTHPRTSRLAAPRRVRVKFSSGAETVVELAQKPQFQIFALPKAETATSVRFVVEDVWPKAGTTETGIGKIRIFAERHAPEFELFAHPMYEVQHGRGVQAATLKLVNPGSAVVGAKLNLAAPGEAPMEIALDAIPARAAVEQYVWIPAPMEDVVMECAASKGFGTQRLRVPRYRSYFDSGTIDLNCTCHNDLGWLSTQKETADFRSEGLIVPALDLMKKYPEFKYSMESVIYLEEFLERHPERREEMAARMREGRFLWGASYVQLLQVHVGPEKLVRQFYLGRRWLKKNFPGADTHYYTQADPPCMSPQMPQILKKCGVKYFIQGRFPFGFYTWQSPDGSEILVRSVMYPDYPIDAEGNEGWLGDPSLHEEYFAANSLPRHYQYDYQNDYLPPQPKLMPYVREQNSKMKEFAAVWNARCAAHPERKIDPPVLRFSSSEDFLDEFTAKGINTIGLSGAWPFAWAYYDEPSNREALLTGRLSHNSLLDSESLHVGLAMAKGFGHYPEEKLAAAWKANLWHDHGWGGNRGLETDRFYAESYERSKKLADEISADLGKLVETAPAVKAGAKIPLFVFNPMAWTRTDAAECTVRVPADWQGWTLVDAAGSAVDFEAVETSGGAIRIAFVAENVPSMGYKRYELRKAAERGGAAHASSVETFENEWVRVGLGSAGIRSFYDKRLGWEALRTGKFEGGEVLDFTAPGSAWEWEDANAVKPEGLERTADHGLRTVFKTESALRQTALREAKFSRFTLRQRIDLYRKLGRVEMGLEVIDWKGTPARELRAAFPVNLDAARLSYEAPFGAVEVGRDELEFDRLPKDVEGSGSQWVPQRLGATHPLPFREALNWIDASSPNYGENGLLTASDTTLHVFHDETAQPVDYPVLQHVLLSTRSSLAWNPAYSFTQAGTHNYRMALLAHTGDWRERYREAVGFNRKLVVFAGEPTTAESKEESGSFLTLEPGNLMVTAFKKSEDEAAITLRFYEAEGNRSRARIKLAASIRACWRTSLIEENEEKIVPLADGSVELNVGAWEIVTLKLTVG
ncbi:MAG: glycosyl hydrolase-related protein [Terracidiphilus sp.]|nr:glycosyl hydrolase-related protein [Terracidiphilus sp.]